MRTGLLLVILVGCGGSNKPAPEPAMPETASLVDCDKVAEHVATTAAQTAKLRSGATYEAITNLVSTRCRGDAWSDETKQCLFAIKAIGEGRDCASKMTDAQREAIHTQAAALRKDATGPVEADDPSGDWVRHVVEEPPAAKPPASKS